MDENQERLEQMPVPSVDEQVRAILDNGFCLNYPHPHYPNKRIVGWAIDEDSVGLGTALLALDEIKARAKRADVTIG